MFTADIKMRVHNACHLCNCNPGHFIYDGKLYIKTQSLGRDNVMKRNRYICVDDDGDYHSDGKNITKSESMSLGGFGGPCSVDVDSELTDMTVVTPITFEWKS